MSSEARRKRFGNGIFYDYDELWMSSLLPLKCVDYVCSQWHPATLLDVGCGTGNTLGEFRSRGIDAWGVEGSEVGIRVSDFSEFMMLHDLRTPLHLGKKFDIVWSFEVAEHIPPNAEAVFLDTLTRHTDRIVMSAAPPGQVGEGHLNEQPRSHWIGQMKLRGWMLNEQATAILSAIDEPLAENLMVFERSVLD